MTTANFLFTDMFAEALSPGQTIGPSNLLAALEAEESPFNAIMHTDGSSPLSMAILQDFGVLRFLRMQSQVVDVEAKRQWIALIRWLLEGIRNWKESDDEHLKKLVAILFTSKLCGLEMGLWNLLPNENPPSTEFLGTIGALLEKCRITYNCYGTALPPIWEKEFVEEFQKADAESRWADIADMWSRIDQAVKLNSLFIEIVCCLARYDFDELVRAIGLLHQCPTVLKLVEVLSTGQLLRLARASCSDRVRFCCVFAITKRNGNAVDLSIDQEIVLSELLITVADVLEEWRKWLAVFNTYPLRYPLIHGPLGRALSQTSYDAAAIYIDSIKLHSNCTTEIDNNRVLISVCLRVFSQHALPEYRQAVWGRAYKRWCNWRFDMDNPDTNLSDIKQSPLDFAVVSYASECMGEVDRENVITDLNTRLLQVQHSWHLTAVDCITEWNRLLSLLQPYAHARSIAETGGDPLPDSRLYYPLCLSQSLYHRIMFQVPENHQNQ